MTLQAVSIARRATYWWLLLCAVFAVGCDTQTSFEADRLAYVDRRIVPEHRQQIEALLGELFGTPDEPRVPPRLASVLDIDLLRQAAGPVESHTPGETLGLFRRHCARCHGVTGDGRGPTALYQHPYPRDFRAGVFKFKSTIRGGKPSSDDLHAVLNRGIPGTAMPSFELLANGEREALVHYVRYLAIRGEFESGLMEYVAEELDFDPATGSVAPGSELLLDSDEVRAVVDDLLQSIAFGPRGWTHAEHKAWFGTPFDLTQMDAPRNAERITAGRELFHDTKRANCVKCHGENGAERIDLADLDDWNRRRYAFAQATQKQIVSIDTLRQRLAASPAASQEQIRNQIAELQREQSLRLEAQAAMLPPVTADPRRLAGGVLHGGDTPADLFRVIHQGIAGTPMPGVGDTLSDEEIVSLVAYVQSLLGAETAPADKN